MENENGLTFDERVSLNTGLITAYNALNIASVTVHDTDGHIDNALHCVMDALDIVGIQPVERCAYCERHASYICDTCGVSLCNDHMIPLPLVGQTCCRPGLCTHGIKPDAPYITCA